MTFLETLYDIALMRAQVFALRLQVLCCRAEMLCVKLETAVAERRTVLLTKCVERDQ